MSLNLLDLPEDCLLMILSMLRPMQIKRLALTFNRRLITLALPLLEPLSKILADESCFESLYGKLQLRDCSVEADRFTTSGTFKHFCLRDRLPSWTHRPSRYLEYLDLKDDIGWLEDCTNIHESVYQSRCSNWTGPRLHDELIEIASRLGLTLLPSFIKLIRDTNLIGTLPHPASWSIQPDPLWKIQIRVKEPPGTLVAPVTDFEEGHGYIFTFLHDQDMDYYFLMYLDQAGRHAIFISSTPCDDRWGDDLTSEHPSPHLTKQEAKLGVQVASPYLIYDMEMQDVDFERWLIHYYYLGITFDMQIRIERGHLLMIPEHVKKYWYYVHTEEGRSI